MRSFLARRWFLLLLVGGLTLAACSPDVLRPLTDRVPPQGIVASALFLMAWGLESRSLGRSLLRPLPALWALAISYGALPALAWVVGRYLIHEELRIGLIISTSVPCTLASAVLWTRMAGGNEATTLLTVLLTTCTSWLATTFWIVVGTGVHVAVQTTDLMLGLFLFLVLPVVVGQSLRLLRPMRDIAGRHRRALGLIAQLLIFTIMLKAAVGVRDSLVERAASLPIGSLLVAIVLCVATHVAALGMGFWGGWLWGFDRPSRIAVAFACSQKTLPVALLLFTQYFKDAYPLALAPLVSYHVGQLVVDTFIADALLHRGIRESEVPAEAIVE